MSYNNNTCRVKKDPYPHHELDIRQGDEYNFEYIGRSTGAQRRTYRLTDKKGRVSYLSYGYFKIYMDYGKEKQ